MKSLSSPRAFRTFLHGWTALVLVFLWAPIPVLAVYSFNTSRLNILWEGFTLRGMPRVSGHGVCFQD